MSNLLNSPFTPRERYIIDVFNEQCSQTNSRIERLYESMYEIKNDINFIINNMSMNNMNNMNNNNMNNNNFRTNYRNRYSFPRRRQQNQYRRTWNNVYYDYTDPISQSTYVDSNNSILTDLLTSFLNTNVIVRPTEEQINNSSRLIRYADIQNPNSLSCAISLEPFQPNDNVRQIHHCNHIFFPEQFDQWFQNNVKCPVCRHDIRSNINTFIPPGPPDNDNEINNIFSSITNHLFSVSNSNDRFT